MNLSICLSIILNSHAETRSHRSFIFVNSKRASGIRLTKAGPENAAARSALVVHNALEPSMLALGCMFPGSGSDVVCRRAVDSEVEWS
jgi:hypothetical protein